MCKNIIFTFSERTLEGYPVIGAGICDMIYVEEAKKSFSKINQINLDVKNLEDPWEIDCLLNRKIASLAPDFIHGLALSIKVEGATGPTGGIIGNPRGFGDTANGQVSSIGNDLSVIALPGGPGMLIKGSKSILKSIFTNVVMGQNRVVSMKRISEELKANQIDLALVVKDGTGKRERGMILTYYHDRMEKLEIDG
ncbi:MAG: hypothetical protein RIN55_02415 [Tissierellaceae bacterium]|nr:hypothetical protein [Tissierellaceae bacterium]